MRLTLASMIVAFMSSAASSCAQQNHSFRPHADNSATTDSGTRNALDSALGRSTYEFKNDSGIFLDTGFSRLRSRPNTHRLGDGLEKLFRGAPRIRAPEKDPCGGI